MKDLVLNWTKTIHLSLNWYEWGEAHNYMNQAIIIEPYDSNLPVYFQKEKNFLIKNLSKDFEIQHIGSSAVSGLGGKNVIDVQLLVPSKKDAHSLIKKLESVGYSYDKKGGDKYRIFFNRDRLYNKKKIPIHLHLMWESAEKYKDYLIFRDYLRNHPQEAKRYYSLKKIWAKKAEDIREKYVKMKMRYVRKIINKVNQGSCCL